MKNWLLVIITVLTATGVQADQIEVIQLRNRSAGEIIPFIRPVMKSGEALSGTGFKLILRASPETVREVRRILSQIDSGLKNLMISVGLAGFSRGEEKAAGGGVGYGTEKGGSVSGYIEHGESTDQSTGTQRIRVLEGQPAWINVGKTWVTPGVVYPPGGGVVYGPVRHDFGTGFYVVPRIVGNRVTLEISQYREKLSGTGPAIDVQSVNTVVTGSLGEWIDIGGAVQSEQRRRRGILSGARSGIDQEHSVSVRVDIAE